MLLRIALALSLFVGIAMAQTPSNDQRIERLERRLDELEQKYQQDVRDRDEEIARLRRQLAETSPPTTTPTPDQIERTWQEVLSDIQSRSASPISLRTPVSFNPDIAVISDFLGTISNHRSNDALNRIDVREVELDLRAAVDPRADAVAILAFARDVENPVFPGDEPPEGPETSVELEEAYLFLHDFGVPNLTAKVGRFHLRFGRQNMLHLHDLPTSDPPLVNQAFLAPESLGDAGISLSYVIPPSLTGGQYIEGILEIISGEGAGSESPTLAGDLSVDSPALNAHVLWNTDLAENLNLELGASWLHGKADSSNDNDVDLFGVDFTLIRRDPTGGFFNQLLQAEVMYGVVDVPDGRTQRAWGAYLLAQQQLNRDWYAGIRLDCTQDPLNDSAAAWAISPYISWYWSEFLRFRLQYQHKDGDVEAEDTLYFQATWIFGAHPPHPYWAIK